MNRERVKGNNRDTFIDSYDYEMLMNDNEEVRNYSVIKKTSFYW